jgi:hypothetical protein
MSLAGSSGLPNAGEPLFRACDRHDVWNALFCPAIPFLPARHTRLPKR